MEINYYIYRSNKTHILELTLGDKGYHNNSEAGGFSNETNYEIYNKYSEMVVIITMPIGLLLLVVIINYIIWEDITKIFTNKY